MKYLDPLYGQINISDDELKLFQTRALTRIRDISLSAVPPITTPSGMITSRFEHSVGVAHLAKLLIKQNNITDFSKNLYTAALFHDVGSPPFSHLSEIFLEEVIGKDHEEFAERILFSHDTKKAIEDFGADTSIVYAFITGQYQPLSDLINGTIDLDNIDNSLRWGMGIGALQNKIYEPEELIKAYIFKDDKLALDASFYSQVQKWELCRRLVYDVVYGDINLTSGAMLFRALQYAFENNELDENFFTLTDSQAFYILENKSNRITSQIISDLRHWNFYIPVAKIIKSGDVSSEFKTICNDWKQRKIIADKIADELKIDRKFVAVYAGKDKGFKKIHLPFIGSDEEITEHIPFQKEYWRLKVYIHPQYQDQKDRVNNILKEILV